MAGWKSSLASVLKEHNGIKASDGTVASHETQQKRATVLYQAFTDLREMGYKLSDVRQLKGRHVEALTKHWLSKGLSSSTLQNRLSTLRTFSSWIGKEGMVERTERYFPNHEATRTSINTQDKSWEVNGVSVKQKLDDLRALDERVALQAELQLQFGLRVKESIMLRPHLADKGSYLAVSIGTKGGRDRTVPIDTPERRELIDRAKTFADRLTASTADPGKSLKQALGHYSRVVAKAGLTKAQLGVTSHGLRHAFANERYAHYSGSRSPVEGGNLKSQNWELDRFARLAVVEELGHSREDVSTHYLGR
ncbi:integrase domain-containing protein [Pseudomonas toyotomiensis]|uniref:Integrase domain-containing protein n=1 Tax=Ectopseudomonas toyotomiensis TaxID=554344 RepID=A0AA42IR67_9GAMM|nr:phage integrase N-terminal domain-containing protein [Pseudomonas toyotomiensis]MDH0704438.1 integrase domain-containing protein [Pseudomonas toyotomiensis]